MNVRLQLREAWPLRRVEWLLALALVGIGMVSFVSYRVEYLPIYEYLWTLIDRGTWAALTLSVGALRLLFLYWNGALRRSPHARAFGAGLGCLAWLALSISIWVSPVVTFAASIWPLFFIFDLNIALSAAGEAATRDRQGTVRRAGAAGDTGIA